jgi:hypothetical protein
MDGVGYLVAMDRLEYDYLFFSTFFMVVWPERAQNINSPTRINDARTQPSNPVV